MLKKNIVYAVCFFMIGMMFWLSGCAATHTAVAHRELDVQTKMSKSVFLDPVESASEKTVYVQFKNTSDKTSFDDFVRTLKAKIESNGYKVVRNLDDAHCLLQCNLRAVTKADPSAAKQVIGAGYHGTAAGTAAGAMIGGAAKNTVSGAAYGAGIGGLLGGITSTVTNAAVKNVTYMGVTDIKISERNKNGEWKPHKTRVVSTANKVNLDFNEAQPIIRKELAHSIAGLF